MASKPYQRPGGPSVFTVRRSVLLEQVGWELVGTVIGGPGSSASFADPASFDRAFYRVDFTPERGFSKCCNFSGKPGFAYGTPQTKQW